jgi:hypothetical protein
MGQPQPSNGELQGNGAQNDKMQRAAESMNVSINFWGKVIDADDHSPIEGATIVLTVRRWSSARLPIPVIVGDTLRRTMESRGDGSFELTDETGDVLDVESVSKEGYKVAPNALRNLNFARDRFQIYPVASLR